jgi:hypothetical protein
MTKLPPEATGKNSQLLIEKQLKKLPSAPRRLRAKICGRANDAFAPESWAHDGAAALPLFYEWCCRTMVRQRPSGNWGGSVHFLSKIRKHIQNNEI